MEFLPVQFVPNAPCLLHVASCEERDILSSLQSSCKYCYTVINILQRLPFSLSLFSFPFYLSLSLSLIFSDNWHIMTLVQETHL